MASSLAPRSYALSSLPLRTTTTSPYIHLWSSLQSFPSSPLSSRYLLLSCRPFSHTTQREASMRNAQILRPQAEATMSSKNQMKEALRSMRDGSIPDDMGLLPGTFIRPLWRNMPSIFRYPKERLWMEWVSLRAKFQDFVGVLAYCKYLNAKNKLPLRLRERKRAARDLYKTMYTAYAAADTATLDNICCDSLRDQFLKRISKRPPQAKKLVWTLHKFIKFPFSTTLTGSRVIADRAAQVAHGVGIRQVVVRIQSRQSLVRPQPPAAESPNEAKRTQPQAAAGEAKSQTSTEYIVLQKMLVAGKEGDWKVWGFVNESTMEDMETNPAFAKGLSLKDRLELMSGAKF
ncbi:hypothetical protein BDBG_06658 [Blastomyces gilchristii SLH14081]|uniref:Tim44-like domain-containing protein n=1 Tax=Blastomyces gilchristii (strain SLH14081) TaxID=559298 RepID=A0A179UUH1_BLAGS|nr:uncharacterized protein BDBG_06658 [Blastomyces gilchristii SLH14081]OAT10879.1 hypothetical protein BDBG_06658 [Blastomyces gilchristii SLH14081]